MGKGPSGASVSVTRSPAHRPLVGGGGLGTWGASVTKRWKVPRWRSWRGKAPSSGREASRAITDTAAVGASAAGASSRPQVGPVHGGEHRQPPGGQPPVRGRGLGGLGTASVHTKKESCDDTNLVVGTTTLER